MKYWWLVENFTAEGHSTGLYMACQVNMTLTADVHKARKFRRQRTAEFRALDMRDARRGDWRAVEHGFDDSKTQEFECLGESRLDKADASEFIDWLNAWKAHNEQ